MNETKNYYLNVLEETYSRAIDEEAAARNNKAPVIILRGLHWRTIHAGRAVDAFLDSQEPGVQAQR